MRQRGKYIVEFIRLQYQISYILALVAINKVFIFRVKLVSAVADTNFSIKIP